MARSGVATSVSELLYRCYFTCCYRVTMHCQRGCHPLPGDRRCAGGGPSHYGHTQHAQKIW